MLLIGEGFIFKLMAITSISFIFFLAAVGLLYWCLPTRYRSFCLLASSYVWYATADFDYIWLLVVATFFDYLFAKKIDVSINAKKKMLFLCLSVVGNLSVLLFFKITTALHDVHWLAPVGVSFYTFHSVSYVVDVWRGKHKAETSFIDYATYVSFFPKLVSGPIERFNEFSIKLKSKLFFQSDFIFRAIYLMIFGLFLKLVIGDSVSLVASHVFDAPLKLNAAHILLGSYAFSTQIYADFLGYTLIARGAAVLFGIELSTNFNSPYFASSPRDFWHRWHISLSTWFRDYIYIPLGGKHKHWAFNAILTMLLAGIWHGASAPYILWGIYHGVLLVTSVMVARYCSIPIVKHKIVSWFFTIILINLGWIFFRAETATKAFSMIKILLMGPWVWDPGTEAMFHFLCLFTIPWIITGLLWKTRIRKFVNDNPFLLNASIAFIAGLCFVCILVLGVPDAVPFIYFKF